MHFIYLTIALTLIGCNGVFYQPDTVDYLSPETDSLKISRFHIPSTNGVMLDAMLIKPIGRANGALVIQFHGNGQNMTAHVAFTAWLSQHGFHVLAFDYRGYGRSTGGADREGLVADGVSVLNYVKRSKDLAPLKRVVVGQSLGGAVAIPSIVTSGIAIDLLILDSSFGSYQDLAVQILDKHIVTWPLQWLGYVLVSDDLAPIEFGPQVNSKWLAVHSSLDPIVPLKAGLDLYASLPQDHGQIWQLNSEGHTTAFYPEWGIRQRLLGHVCKTLDLKLCEPKVYFRPFHHVDSH